MLLILTPDCFSNVCVCNHPPLPFVSGSCVCGSPCWSSTRPTRLWSRWPSPTTSCSPSSPPASRRRTACACWLPSASVSHLVCWKVFTWNRHTLYWLLIMDMFELTTIRTRTHSSERLPSLLSLESAACDSTSPSRVLHVLTVCCCSATQHALTEPSTDSMCLVQIWEDGPLRKEGNK